MAKTKKDESIVDDKLEAMEKAFGKGTMVKASDRKGKTVKEVVSTGSLTLDVATGIGGIPKGGNCTCILGKEGSSKTTLALHIIAEDQKKGNICCFLDVEDSIDLDYAQNIGVDLDKLYLVDREFLLKELGIKDRDVISGEEWLEFLCRALKSNIYSTVVMDSVAALVPMVELLNGIQGGRLAGVASMMAKAYRAVNSALTVSDSAFVYLNQYRMNPGGYVPLVEPGGEAWKYLQVLKLEISKSVDKDGDGAYGIVVKGKVTKSKVGIPFKTFEYYVEFGKGIQRVQEIIDLSLESGEITKGGAWYNIGDQKFQGEAAVKQFLLDNPGFMDELEKKIMNKT